MRGLPHLGHSRATSHLRSLREPCSLFDAAGNQLGYFLPQVDSEHYEGLFPPFTREELKSANDESGARKLADILADLDRKA